MSGSRRRPRADDWGEAGAGWHGSPPEWDDAPGWESGAGPGWDAADEAPEPLAEWDRAPETWYRAPARPDEATTRRERPPSRRRRGAQARGQGAGGHPGAVPAGPPGYDPRMPGSHAPGYRPSQPDYYPAEQAGHLQAEPESAEWERAPEAWYRPARPDEAGYHPVQHAGHDRGAGPQPPRRRPRGEPPAGMDGYRGAVPAGPADYPPQMPEEYAPGAGPQPPPHGGPPADGGFPGGHPDDGAPPHGYLPREPESAEWERAPEAWYRAPARPGDATVRQFRRPDRPRRARPVREEPAAGQHPPGWHPRPPHPTAAPPAPAPPARPARTGSRLQRTRARHRPHPWGLMAAVTVAVTLTVYGLVRFGYFTQVQLDYGMGLTPGPAPVIKLQSHYVGVATENPFATNVPAFAHVMGRNPGIVEYYQGFGSSRYPFESGVATYLAKNNILSLIQINPRNISLADIASGRYDSYLKWYAGKVAAFKSKVAISFAHEMNGWWYTWGMPRSYKPGQPTTQPQDFVKAWRHIHDIFAQQGATNVIWVWTVSRDANRPGWPSVKQWWPGSKYVDWVGLDGYFRKPGETFTTVFSRQLGNLGKFTKKPVLICETAADARSADQSTQIASLFSGIRSTPNMLGFVWFDMNALGRWKIDSDQAAIQAFRQALKAPL
jgi:glycosyl hydrolase family 26